MTMTKIKALAVVFFLLICLCGCTGERGLTYEKDEKLLGTHNAVITVKDYGEIKLELYGDIAPVTVANFVKLVNKGFYNGLTFHRAVENFMLQGGDPNGDSTGNTSPRIYGEFSDNGFENTLLHKRGVISMARPNDYNGASCQFFIMLADKPEIDGKYAAFGKVIEGMEILDKVMEDIYQTDYNGLIPANEQPIIEKIEMTD